VDHNLTVFSCAQLAVTDFVGFEVLQIWTCSTQRYIPSRLICNPPIHLCHDLKSYHWLFATPKGPALTLKSPYLQPCDTVNGERSLTLTHTPSVCWESRHLSVPVTERGLLFCPYVMNISLFFSSVLSSPYFREIFRLLPWWWKLKAFPKRW
jgi:hypothetical protein